MPQENQQDLSRRHFIATGALLAASSAHGASMSPNQPQDQSTDPNPISPETIAQAQNLAALNFTKPERDLIAKDIHKTAEQYLKRRDFQLPNGTGPMETFDPRLPGAIFNQDQNAPTWATNNLPLPDNETDIAYAPITTQAHWIKTQQITSYRLTSIYLKRLEQIGPKLQCTITLTQELAIQQATKADQHIAAGNYKGILHGIPWGAKDLLDTARIPTTWGATPYKNRIPKSDAVVVKRLADAGAVLIAKLTLGALAYGDIWFGGKTKNPWNLNQGSSGSSAGPAAATAAGLVGFSIGTETYGSIVSPCMRCGTTGLRPTFGRVPRTGAMALCWSLDKIGPICRTVQDTMAVLNAINGQHTGDGSSLDMPLNFDANASVKGLRVGYVPAWFEGNRVSDIDRNALSALKRTGVELVEIELPDWPYASLLTILYAEAAAAFEELTLTNRDDELIWQEPQSWPNTFRKTWFTPAIELIQAQRLRRRVCEMMHDKFNAVDAMFGPSFAGNMLLITNNTGHPCLTLRAGIRSNNRPHGVTLWGKLFDEGTICNIGMALEKELNIWNKRPAIG